MGNPSSSQPPHASDATPVDDPAAHPWRRYVAIGDSFSEGIGDPDPDRPGYHRGWADRVAETLAEGTQNFAYANLAVRGKLIAQIRDEQIAPALELRPDLVISDIRMPPSRSDEGLRAAK